MSTRRCTAGARCLPAREGEAGIAVFRNRTAGIDKDPIELPSAETIRQLRPSVGEQIAAGHRKARRAVRQNGRAGIPRAGAPRHHQGHRDHTGQEASEERDDEIQARRKQQDCSVAFLAARRQARSHQSGLRIELGKRQGKPLGAAVWQKNVGRVVRLLRRPMSEHVNQGRKLGSRLRFVHRPARVAKCRASSPIVGCSNSRSGVSSKPSQSSSSTLKNTEFAESSPTRANVISGSTVWAGKSSVRARYSTHQSRIAASLVFSARKTSSLNDPAWTPASLTAVPSADKGQVASARQREVDENEGACGADFEKTGSHQSHWGAVT